MSDAYVAGLFTLAGGALGFLGAWVISNRAAKIEERKNIREIGMKMALARHENCVRAAQQIANVTGKVEPIPPLEVCVVDGVRLMEIVSSPGLTATEMATRILEYRDYTKTVSDAIQNQEKRNA